MQTPKFVYLKGVDIIISLDSIARINTKDKTVKLKGESFAYELTKGDDYRTLIDFIKADLLNYEGLYKNGTFTKEDA